MSLARCFNVVAILFAVPFGPSFLPEAMSKDIELPGATLAVPTWIGTSEEPFAVKEFLESRTPPLDNAASAYLRALTNFGVEMAFAVPEAERERTAQQVRTLAARITDLGENRRAKLREAEDERLAEILELAREGLQEIERAQQKRGCVFVAGLSLDSGLPHVQASRQVSRVTQVELCEAMRKEDVEAGVRSIRRLLRLSRDLRVRGTILAQLVSIAIDANLMEDIRHFTLATPTLKATDCDHLLALLEEHQRLGPDPLAEGFRMEYVLARNTLRDVEFGRLLAKELGVDGDVGPGKTFNWAAEVAECNKLYTILLSLTEKEAHERRNDRRFEQAVSDLQRRVAAERKEKQEADPWKGPVLTSIFAPALGQAIQADLRHRTQLVGTIALTAVKRYQLVHGKLPLSLDTAFADAVVKGKPTDPYTGQPMAYQFNTGEAIIRSAGRNGKVEAVAEDADDIVFSVGR